MHRFSSPLSPPPRATDADTIALPDGLAVAVRRSARARRLRLTVNADGVATVVVPRRVSLATARAFVHREQAWVARHCQRRQAVAADMQQACAPDAQGRPTRILLRGEWADVAWGRMSRVAGAVAPGARVVIAGDDIASLARRLRAHARADAQAIIDNQAPHLRRPAPRLSIRDQSTRWGSLSGRGTLSLNWRLILAPADVLAYVVNHELAHLEHPHHQPTFWAEVQRLMPDYESPRRWLRDNGDSLRLILPV